jgi:hypothetical protein
MSAALFQLRLAHINLHSVCDLTCFVFEKPLVLFSAPKPPTMTEFLLTFLSILWPKCWQDVKKYTKNSSFLSFALSLSFESTCTINTLK